MTRLFTNRGDGAPDDVRAGDLPKMQANFANALAMLARSLDEMNLAQVGAFADTVSRVAEPVLAIRALVCRSRADRESPSRSGAANSTKPRSLKPVPARQGAKPPWKVRRLKAKTPNRYGNAIGTTARPSTSPKSRNRTVRWREMVGLDTPVDLLRHVSPLGRAHILLTGQYPWRRMTASEA